MDRAALARLVASISRFLEPGAGGSDQVVTTAGDLELLDIRGDLEVATREDFFMATDTAWSRRRAYGDRLIVLIPAISGAGSAPLPR